MALAELKANTHLCYAVKDAHKHCYHKWQRIDILMKYRTFKSGILNHCYQRSADHGLIFYSQNDYLVWFTTVCTVAPRHKIKILGLCPMPDHIHMAVIAQTKQDLSRFMGEVNRTFSKLQNDVCHLKWSWFERPFGSVPKEGSKVGRNCLLYVGNNPPERQLAEKAEDYRWTFLAYAVSTHPFSEKLVIRNATWPMRQAIKEVRAQHKAGKPLKYNLLQRLFQRLNNGEVEQLIDFIVSSYDVIDHKEALRFFDGSYKKMTEALSLSTAKEYDLNESFVGKSDKPYATMARMILEKYKLDDIHQMLSWPQEQKAQAFRFLRTTTRYVPEQISKFLHWWGQKKP